MRLTLTLMTLKGRTAYYTTAENSNGVRATASYNYNQSQERRNFETARRPMQHNYYYSPVLTPRGAVAGYCLTHAPFQKNRGIPHILGYSPYHVIAVQPSLCMRAEG